MRWYKVMKNNDIILDKSPKKRRKISILRGFVTISKSVCYNEAF